MVGLGRERAEIARHNAREVGALQHKARAVGLGVVGGDAGGAILEQGLQVEVLARAEVVDLLILIRSLEADVVVG